MSMPRRQEILLGMFLVLLVGGTSYSVYRWRQSQKHAAPPLPSWYHAEMEEIAYKAPVEESPLTAKPPFLNHLEDALVKVVAGASGGICAVLGARFFTNAPIGDAIAGAGLGACVVCFAIRVVFRFINPNRQRENIFLKPKSYAEPSA